MGRGRQECLEPLHHGGTQDDQPLRRMAWETEEEISARASKHLCLHQSYPGNPSRQRSDPHPTCIWRISSKKEETLQDHRQSTDTAEDPTAEWRNRRHHVRRQCILFAPFAVKCVIIMHILWTVLFSYMLLCAYFIYILYLIIYVYRTYMSLITNKVFL